MKALVYERKLMKYAAAATAGALVAGLGARVGPVALKNLDPPEPPGDGWVQVRPRLSGICGSDLATVDGHSTRYFEPIVSFPFVLGHEVVGDLDDDTRVVIEPVLGCVTRGIEPVCQSCAAGDLGNCEMVAYGRLEPGLQSGYCCDTGGGWSIAMVAHESQLHRVPDEMSDEAAVMVEPAACAIHAALAGGVSNDDTVAVIGAGSVGLLTLAALRRYTSPRTLIVAAKHAGQQTWARRLGADTAVAPGELRRTVRRATGSLAMGGADDMQLTGGADLVIDCVGSEASLTDALAVVRPRGTVVAAGMPGRRTLDLTGLWHREVRLQGAYAYGTEIVAGSPRRTFDLAFELVRADGLGDMVSATYRLDRYTDAIAHAAAAGPRGGVKIAFDLRNERERSRL